MTMFAQPMGSDGGINDELLALSKLEATSNAIRLRIAGLAPDQLYNGAPNELPIAELIANAVEREKAYLAGFQRVKAETAPHLAEPQPGLAYMDRDFADDLALFFDLRRLTLDQLRSYSDADWARTVVLPDGATITAEALALRLQRHDAQLLAAISKQKRAFMKTTGVDELRDMGVAGKLGQNLAQ